MHCKRTDCLGVLCISWSNEGLYWRGRPCVCRSVCFRSRQPIHNTCKQSFCWCCTNSRSRVIKLWWKTSAAGIAKTMSCENQMSHSQRWKWLRQYPNLVISERPLIQPAAILRALDLSVRLIFFHFVTSAANRTCSYLLTRYNIVHAGSFLFSVSILCCVKRTLLHKTKTSFQITCLFFD